MKIQTIIQIVLISFLFLNVESKKINCLHLQQDECIKNKDKCFLSNVNSCCEKDFLMCLPISSKYCESQTDDVFSNKNILKKSPPSSSHEWCLKKKKSILRFNTSCVPELDLDSEYFKPNLYKCKYSKCQKGFKCVDEKLHKKCETENNPCCKYESKCVPSKDIDQNEAPIFKNPKGQLAQDIYNHLNPDSPQFKDKPNHENHKKDKNNKKHKKDIKNNSDKNNNNNNNNNNKKNKTINNNEPNQNQQSNPIDRTFNNETPFPWNFKNQDQQQQKQEQTQKQTQKEYFKAGSPYPVLPNLNKEPTTHLNTIEPTSFTASASRYQLEGNDNKDEENIDENNGEDKKKKKKKKKDDKSKKPKDDEKHTKKPNVTEQPADDPSIEITEEPTITPSSSPVHQDPCKKATCPNGSHCLVYGNQAYCKLDKPPNYQTMSPLPQKQQPSVKKMDSLSMFYKKSKMLLSEYTTEQRPQLTCSTIKCEDDEVCINKVGLNPYCQIKPPPKPVSYNKTSCSQCPIGSYRCNPNPNGSGVICETDAINCRLIACKEGEFCIDNIENTPPKCYPKLLCNLSKIPPDYYCISDEIRGGFYVKYESYIDLSCETLLCEGVNSYCVENGGPICKTWPNDTIQYQPSCDKCPKDTMSCTPNENSNNKGVVCRIDRPSCSVIQCPDNQYCVNTDKGPKCYKRSIECSNSRCPRDYTCKRDEIRGGACLKN